MWLVSTTTNAILPLTDTASPSEGGTSGNASGEYRLYKLHFTLYRIQILGTNNQALKGLGVKIHSADYMETTVPFFSTTTFTENNNHNNHHYYRQPFHA